MKPYRMMLCSSFLRVRRTKHYNTLDKGESQSEGWYIFLEPRASSKHFGHSRNLYICRCHNIPRRVMFRYSTRSHLAQGVWITIVNPVDQQAWPDSEQLKTGCVQQQWGGVDPQRCNNWLSMYSITGLYYAAECVYVSATATSGTVFVVDIPRTIVVADTVPRYHSSERRNGSTTFADMLNLNSYLKEPASRSLLA